MGVQNKDPKKTLLLVCEEGEEEYDPEVYDSLDVDIRYIEDEATLTKEYVDNLEEDTGADRILIEYNGMWNTSLPRRIWDPQQIYEIMLVDTTTFEMYLNNLKALIADKIRTADMMLFKRCNEEPEKLAMYRRSARALNNHADIVFRNDDGEIELDQAVLLPFDPDSDPLNIEDDTFAAFFIDTMENPDRYVGKTVNYTGMVFTTKSEKGHSFLLGRIAMTCCAEDLTLFGFICDYDGDIGEIRKDDWLNITCVMEKEYSEKYGIWHPICKVTELSRCKEREKVIDVK